MNGADISRAENPQPQPSAAGVEPWMSGTHTDLDVLRRAVVHALEQALADGERWAGGLTEDQMFCQHGTLAPPAFHLRHAARSLDRLLTYAEDRALDQEQLAALRSEADPGTAEDVRREFRTGLESALARVCRIDPALLSQPRGVGRKRLPSTVGGLLIHCAEHTQRHIGQLITTVKALQSDQRASGRALPDGP